MIKFKYITVSNFKSGQVYLYAFNEMDMPNAEDFVASRHNLDNVRYIVHKHLPNLKNEE